MVQRARLIKWTNHARKTRLEIFSYWNNRNKSKLYSQKLNLEFNKSLKQVALIPETGIVTNNENVRLKIVSHFEIVYLISNTQITVLDIFDTRQNPLNHPIK